MTPAQCKAARALLGLDQRDLARKARLNSCMPVSYFERYGDVEYDSAIGAKRRVSRKALNKIKETFEEDGIEFIEDTGVNLKRKRNDAVTVPGSQGDAGLEPGGAVGEDRQKK